MNKKYTHYKLPEELLKTFKVECAREGRTMNSIIIMLIKVWLKGIRERGE